jgi:mannose-6-phosphate isomerase
MRINCNVFITILLVVQQLIGKQDVASLRAFFKSFIYADLEVVTLQLQSLRSRLETQAQNGRVALTPVEKLVLRLNAEYSNDIGCFCPYILNYITLQPGEAVFLGANEPHAYLSGDCIECMACSDNVVRAGLTPKYIDKVTLHEMLTYRYAHVNFTTLWDLAVMELNGIVCSVFVCRTGPPTVFKGDKVNEMSRLYSPPVPEFQVEVIELAAYQHYAVPKREDSPSVLLVVSGSASGTCGEEAPFTLSKGSVFFVPAGEELDLRCGSDGISAFRASPNQSARQH